MCWKHYVFTTVFFGATTFSPRIVLLVLYVCHLLYDPVRHIVCAVFLFVQGDVEQLQQWTGEACFNKLSSEAKQRKADGMVLVRAPMHACVDRVA